MLRYFSHPSVSMPGSGAPGLVLCVGSLAAPSVAEAVEDSPGIQAAASIAGINFSGPQVGLLIFLVALIVALIIANHQLRKTIRGMKRQAPDSAPGVSSSVLSDAQFRTIFEAAPVGLIISRPDGTTVDANAAACAMHGYSRDEFLSLRPPDFIHVSSLHKFQQYMDVVMGGEQIQLSAQDLRRDGSIFDVDVIGVPIQYEGVPHGLGIVQDVTSRKAAEWDLRIYQERLKIVLETLPVMLWASDASGAVTVSEGSGLACMGVEPGELVGESFERCFAPYPNLVAAAHACASGTPTSQTFSAGEAVFEMYFQPTRDERGAVVGISAIGVDATETHAAEEALRVSEERYRSIVETTREWIWEIDLGAGHVYSNHAIEEILGYSVEELLAAETFDLMHPDDRDTVQACLPEFIADRCGWENWVLRWRHKDGDYRSLESNAAPVLDRHGNLAGFRGVDRDITQRLEAERLLQESMQVSADIVRVMPSGLIIYRFEEPDHLYVEDSNPEATRLLDEPIAELRGREFDEIWSYPGDERIKAAFLDVMKSGETWRDDYFRYSGDALSLALRVRAFRMPASRLGVAFEDILDRKRIEDELDRYRHQLEELVYERTRALEAAQAELLRKERLATLGQIIGSVSHELRNPLGTVRMSVFTIAQLLQSEKFDRIPRTIARAERAVVRCDRIIEELLDFTRQRALHRTKEPIDRWLRDVVNDLEPTEGITYRWDLQADTVLSIDSELFRRAVINLISNGAQAMQEPEATGKTLTIATRRSQDSIEIDFEDEGAGMTDDVMARILEPLFSTKGFGVGLGVPIINDIIEAHGGTLHYESEIGKGTCARVRLPIAPPDSGHVGNHASAVQ